MTTAAERWQTQLASWAIPETIRAEAPTRDPWRLQVSSFVEHALRVTGDSRAAVLGRTALGDGGTVLDVGCGGGAATVGLGDAVTHATGVDEREDMLEAFREVATSRGITNDTIVGRWPDDADAAPMADVVVSNHVVYNVPDIAGFMRGLNNHARRRVVLEVHAEHPRAWTNPYWQRVRGLDRPSGPTVGDLVAVTAELGLSVNIDIAPGGVVAMTDRDRRLAHLQDHLCLPDARHDELAAADDELWPLPDRDVATIWWDV